MTELNDRPLPGDLARARRTRLTHAASALLVVSMLIGSAWALSVVGGDARVPIHFNVRGEADGWAPARYALWMMPGLAALLLVLMACLPRVDPKGANLARSAPAVSTITLAVTALLALVHALIINHAVVPQDGPLIDVQLAVPMAMSVLLIVVGNVMGKVRWNHTVGIRTPWTLADERVWDQTHRFGGRCMVAGGIGLLLCQASIGSHSVGLWSVVVVLVVVAATVLKSYLLWRGLQHPSR